MEKRGKKGGKGKSPQSEKVPGGFRQEQLPQRHEQPQMPHDTAQDFPLLGAEGDKVVEKMADLPTGSTKIPKRAERPQTPKKGREIIVETNHLALNIKNKNMVVFHYDVAVNPEKPFRIYRKALQEVQKRCYPNRYPAFDGKKNLYSYPELPFGKKELVETVTVFDEERDQTKEVTVTIKFANTVNMSLIGDYLRCGSTISAPQEAIQALDIVLRQPAANRLFPLGKSFFSPPPGRIINLGDGLDLWYGFFQSAIMGWKPFLNIDVVHKGFPRPVNCVDALAEIVGQGFDVYDPRFRLQRRQEEAFLAYIKNLKVKYEIPQRGVKRTSIVTGLSKCARDNIFEVVDKESKKKFSTTVKNYFFNQYKYDLKFPHLPCLTVGTKKQFALPIELCRIVEGQASMKKMNELQTRNMVKEAAVDPESRKRKTMESFMKINFNSDRCLNEFGLSVAARFTEVKARILNAPTVDYRENKPVVVTQGVWKNEKFLVGAKLLQWKILNISRYVRDQELRYFGEKLVVHGERCGMIISRNYDCVTIETDAEIKRFFIQCKEENVNIVIVILPDRGDTYASIKKIAELDVGILTQCVKTSTVKKSQHNAAIFVNMLHKVNAKLNGINHNITHSLWPEFFRKPVMVVGADVTHPAPDQTNIPSIAAVTASYESKAFKYNMIWKLQNPKEEVIRDLREIMREQLLMFYRNTNKCKPEAILYYRDGVSEGYFKRVLNVELTAIRQACSDLESDYKPAITFLVVQKRHHTRFFPNKKDADGRNKNVPAGTVVDTEITHPTELDFYLVSHASIQGTARPTKYHLLWDDSDMPVQDLEEITYYLCHLFSRCTRSVSYPAPTYCAHLAAFRGRSYIDAERLQLDRLNEEQNRRQIRDSVYKITPMFYN